MEPDGEPREALADPQADGNGRPGHGDAVMDDAAGQEDANKDDVRGEKELVVTIAKGLERQEDHEGEDDVGYDAAEEAVVLKGRIKDGVAKGVDVDHELLCPESDVSGREHPNEAAYPAVKDCRLVRGVVGQPRDGKDGKRVQAEGQGDDERQEGIGDQANTRRGRPQCFVNGIIVTLQERIVERSPTRRVESICGRDSDTRDKVGGVLGLCG